MVQRIVKLLGCAYATSGDVHVQATYNGVEILNGPVTTNVTDVVPHLRPPIPPPVTQLGLFETTTDATGQIPVTISVTGGTLFFTEFRMNYTGYVAVRQAIGSGTLIDPDNPDTYIWVVTMQPDSHYSSVNTITVESDGISNLTKNGEPWPWRVNVGTSPGVWIYPVADGETVTFDFFVDPTITVLVPN
jgi:hypothetical protein